MSTDELIEESNALTPKGQATRDRIVATAAELIHDNGIANTSLGDVQKAAQVGASQVYHYFSDKQSLIRAVVNYRVDGRARNRALKRRWSDLDGGATGLA